MMKRLAIGAALAACAVFSSVAAFRLGVAHGFGRALAEFDSYSAVTSEKAFARTVQRALSNLQKGDGAEAQSVLTSYMVISSATLSDAMARSKGYEFFDEECRDVLRIADAIAHENLLQNVEPRARQAYDRNIARIRVLCNPPALQKV
jgi:hypothetical protein